MSSNYFDKSKYSQIHKAMYNRFRILNSEKFSRTKKAKPVKYNNYQYIIRDLIFNKNTASYRDILYSKTMPNLTMLFCVLMGSILLLLIGIFIFRKLEKGFAEEV